MRGSVCDTAPLRRGVVCWASLSPLTKELKWEQPMVPLPICALSRAHRCLVDTSSGGHHLRELGKRCCQIRIITLVHVSADIWESGLVSRDAEQGKGVSVQRSVPAGGPFLGVHSYGEEWLNEVLWIQVLVNLVLFC